jgi:hypothetical protein
LIPTNDRMVSDVKRVRLYIYPRKERTPKVGLIK